MNKNKKVLNNLKIKVCKIFPKLSPKLRKKCRAYETWLNKEDENVIERQYLLSVMPKLKKPNFSPYLIPYPWTENYWNQDIQVKWSDQGNPYVIHNGEKLFFPRDYAEERVRNAYKQLLIEQDEQSPHKYYGQSVNASGTDIFIDVGCAEAIMALDMVKSVEKVILVECSIAWIEALKMTFEPWKEKVTIINKFAGEECSETFITIDKIVENINQNKKILIKMDLEGNEITALHGATETLKRKNIAWVCAVYHLKNDEVIIPAYFNKFGYSTEFSNNKIIRYSKEDDAFFMTHGIVRCYRT